MWEEMERQCGALEEIATRRRNRDEGGTIVLPIRSGNSGHGCSKDDNVRDDGDDDYYTAFYQLLGMK